MSLEKICVKDVVTAPKSAKVGVVVDLMKKHHVGSVVILEGLGKKSVPLGIITDRDIALTVGVEQNPSHLKVETVMQSQPVTAKVTDGVFETLKKMREFGVKRIPLVDKSGDLCGILAAEDLLNLLSQEMNELSKIGEVQLSNERGVRLPTEKQLVM
ncbi:MAG: CBS domain-containing protein [Bdellovibrionales bacterium]|nr:CBS domain-containing protein [Bdellovibrionales bacterium]